MADFPDGEIFPSPVVTAVAFEIRFPSLFYLEQRIGELQLRLIERFPESRMSITRQFLFAESTEEDPGTPERRAGQPVSKSWEFSSSAGVAVEIMHDKLILRSKQHKTYKSGEGERFRDSIEFVLTAFAEVLKVPVCSRVGLRYVDACPLPARTSVCLQEHYSPNVNLDRFPLETTQEYSFRAVTTKDDISLRFVEKYDASDSIEKLILDFDAFCIDVRTQAVLETTDRLHRAIREQFKLSIREPVLALMRNAQ